MESLSTQKMDQCTSVNTMDIESENSFRLNGQRKVILFPLSSRQRISTILNMSHRRGTLFNRLPRDLLFVIIQTLSLIDDHSTIFTQESSTVNTINEQTTEGVKKKTCILNWTTGNKHSTDCQTIHSLCPWRILYNIAFANELQPSTPSLRTSPSKPLFLQKKFQQGKEKNDIQCHNDCREWKWRT